MEILIIEHFVSVHSGQDVRHSRSFTDTRSSTDEIPIVTKINDETIERWNASRARDAKSKPQKHLLELVSIISTSFTTDPDFQTKHFQPNATSFSAHNPPVHCTTPLRMNFCHKISPPPIKKGKGEIIYFSKFETFLLLLLCLIWKGANNNRNNIFHILYSISTYNR